MIDREPLIRIERRRGIGGGGEIAKERETIKVYRYGWWIDRLIDRHIEKRKER